MSKRDASSARIKAPREDGNLIKLSEILGYTHDHCRASYEEWGFEREPYTKKNAPRFLLTDMWIFKRGGTPALKAAIAKRRADVAALLEPTPARDAPEPLPGNLVMTPMPGTKLIPEAIEIVRTFRAAKL